MIKGGVHPGGPGATLVGQVCFHLVCSWLAPVAHQVCFHKTFDAMVTLFRPPLYLVLGANREMVLLILHSLHQYHHHRNCFP